MIVAAGNQTGRVAVPDLANVLDLSENVGADSWMADGGTNLLAASRWKVLRNLAIAVVVLAVVGVGAFFLLGGKKEDTNQAVAPVPADAAVPVEDPKPKPDAGPSRDDILAISKFGFFSIDATAKTTIYVDNVRLGETPMKRAPLQPGPHKVRAVTKGKKPKEFEITVIGGRDTDEGMLEW
jgi:hypothetical protein